MVMVMMMMVIMVVVTELEEIPEDLKFCTELQVLDITGNPLQK